MPRAVVMVRPMLVYGDRSHSFDVPATLQRIGDHCHAHADTEERTRDLVELGMIGQAALDLRFEARGQRDDYGAYERAWDRAMRLAARAALHQVEVPELAAALLALPPLPSPLLSRVAEGFAFYTLLPAAVAAAARRLGKEEAGPFVIVGLRSIGVTLAAVLAAALARVELVVTVRPTGPPFQRRLRTEPRLEALCTALADRATFVVVDEGPGLSGSSFAATAEWLEALGATRICFVPSHGGEPGPRASERTRSRWSATTRYVPSFDQTFRRGSPTLLQRLVSRALRTDARESAELHGGQWRQHLDLPQDEWPPANVARERTKLLLTSPAGPILARFVGLGPQGERACRRAASLHALVPEPLGFTHGFLLERWRPEDTMASPSNPVSSSAVVEYLSAIASVPAEPWEGSNIQELVEMVQCNASEILGTEVVDAWREGLDEAALVADVRRVQTDNRLHVWEWRVDAAGRWRKCDALDHGAAHDLVGAQDLAWDVAGACVELGLDAETLVRALAERGVVVRHLPFYVLAYCAFWLGSSRQAQLEVAFDPAEVARFARHEVGYEARLRACFDRWRSAKTRTAPDHRPDRRALAPIA